MFQPIWKAMAEEFSGEAAWDQTAAVYENDRLSTTAAFARTADYLVRRMRELGLADIERIPFKADGRTLLGDWIPSPAWDAEEAELAVLEPAELAGRLCRYPENPICLAMNSGATPAGGITAPLVDPALVKGRRALRGAFVLPGIAERPRNVREKYAKLGVAGIVSDFRPGGDDLNRRAIEPQATYWENVWHELWDRPRPPVFKIPPAIADRLRAALKAGKKIVVHAIARCRNYRGRIDTVTGVIPGRDRQRRPRSAGRQRRPRSAGRQEEIIVVGHVYEIGANDNASGAGCMLELARTLMALVKRRAIPRFRRSIRFIFPWECYGSQAYVLSETGRRHTALAGINPDMVGNDQCRCGSALEVSRSPDCCPSPGNAFLDQLLKTLSDEDPLYRWQWSGPSGDDGLSYADPAIGAGTPGITLWPDRFYHSNQDTMDKVSPKSLKQAGTVMGTYVAFLAAAGRREALWLANAAYRWSRERLEALVAAALAEDKPAADDPNAASPAERFEWLRDRAIDHIRSTARFVPEGERPAFLKRLAQFETLMKVDVVGAVERTEKVSGTFSEKGVRYFFWKKYLTPFPGADLVPRRLIGGYPCFDRLSPRERKAFTAKAIGGLPGGYRGALIFYLCDGRRTIAEIDRWLRGEFGSSDLKQLLRTFRLLELFGYLKLGKA